MKAFLQIKSKLFCKFKFLVFASLLSGLSPAYASDVYDFGDRVPTLEELQALLKSQRSIVHKPSSAKPQTDAKKAADPTIISMRIQFEMNSAEIKPTSYAQISRIGQLLQGDSQIALNVIGHADAHGEDHANLQLSERRAFAVRNALIYGHGIAAGRLSALGMGEKKPRLDDPYDPLNRRVEFQVTQ